MSPMSVDAGEVPSIPRVPLAALPWALFAAVLLALISCDLNVNPILDEEQWLQSGLATAHHHFLKTGMVSGPLYGLVLGLLFGGFYAVGLLFGAFTGTLDFVSWFLSHQSVFYFISRTLTAGIAAGGLAMLARTLRPRIGGFAASLIAVGFAFTVPVVDRIAYATPHGSMIGFSAALIAVLLRAREGGSPIPWMLAGAIVAAASTAITIGLGLGLLAFWGAWFPPAAGGSSSRSRRLGLMLAGFLGGLGVFGYPILLNPREYWMSNIQYQISRQILTDEGGRGRLLHDWLLEGLTLWLAGLAGVLWGRFREGRILAVGALVTATGYLFFLAVVTRSAQVSYSLAALPCLAYAASGLVEPLRRLKPHRGALAAAAVLLVPSTLAARKVAQRLVELNPRVVSAARVMSTQPPGTTLLVDTWYGPRLLHPRLLLASYGKAGAEWYRDPGFRASLERRLPQDHAAWTVIPFPAELPIPDRTRLRTAGVDVVILSDVLKEREPAQGAWKALISDGTLQPIPPDAPGGVRFYRVAKDP